jgi:2-polyprenyl-3-methyl-5-hydroxy-6-metoxy-1,4-benzoquinol methylase
MAAQVEDWFSPLTKVDFAAKRVLELGCGNGSLIAHVVKWHPALLEGVDLGNAVVSARRNFPPERFPQVSIVQTDLTQYVSDGFDVVYSIGVLHHLQSPEAGFAALINNLRHSGKFHEWVYAHEGNAIIRYVVDPLCFCIGRTSRTCPILPLAVKPLPS